VQGLEARVEAGGSIGTLCEGTITSVESGGRTENRWLQPVRTRAFLGGSSRRGRTGPWHTQRNHRAHSHCLGRKVLVGQRSLTLPVDAGIARGLTPGDGRADPVANLDIEFEVWSELYDLSCEVTPGVSAFNWEVLVGWVSRTDGRDLRRDRECRAQSGENGFDSPATSMGLRPMARTLIRTSFSPTSGVGVSLRTMFPP